MKRCLLVALLINSLSQHLFASGFESYGDIGQYAVPVSAFVVTVLLKDKQGALQLGEAYGVTVGVTQLLKHVVEAERPNGSSKSFPSGHTASAFAGAAFLQRRYGWHYGAIAYGAATMVGVSRIDANKHWMRDVVAGAAIGILSNVIFTTRYYKKCQIEVSPYVDQEGRLGAAAMVNWTWPSRPRDQRNCTDRTLCAGGNF